MPPGTDVRQHAEVRDVEAALHSTKRLLNIAERTHRRVHVLHVSAAEEIALLRERDLSELVTAEVTPNHLFLSAPDCYERYGRLAQINPPVRDRRHQEALREALADGTLHCIGSDHAQHALHEKALPYPKAPSGIPGTQTILPLLLCAVRDGWLQLQDIVRIGLTGVLQAYPLPNKTPWQVGTHGDVVLVDPSITAPLRLEWLHSRAGFWSLRRHRTRGLADDEVASRRSDLRRSSNRRNTNGRPSELSWRARGNSKSETDDAAV